MKKVRDHFFKKAKKEGFLARSVYKLQEADKKYGLLKKGAAVVDLGAAPGSWTQYAAERVGEHGVVVAVDIHSVRVSAPNVEVLKCDALELEPEELLERLRAVGREAADGLMSDMAPKTSGNRSLDHIRSVGLAESALHMALALVGPEGFFFCKVFQGGEFDSFLKQCRASFHEVKVFKPKSSRKESVEVFIFGRKPIGK